MCCLFCENASPESTVFRAVQAASKTFVGPGAISIIRNGGWEGAFRNEIMLELEKQNQQLLGFTEGADRKAVRVDLMIRCTECKESKLKCGIETKINFSTQPAQEIVKQLEDGFAKASRLASLPTPPPVFVVHAVADLWYVSGNERAAQHNDVVGKRSYKRFQSHYPAGDRAIGRLEPVKRWIFDDAEWRECQRVCRHPEESTLSVSEEVQPIFGNSLRVWIAQVLRTKEEQYQLRFMRTESTFDEERLLRSRSELDEILAKNKKPICWSPEKPKREPKRKIQ